MITNFELSIYAELKVLCIMAIDAIETVDESTITKRTLIAQHNQLDLRKTSLDIVNTITTKITKENARQFRNIHSFITCCGNISKLLWFNPNNGDKKLFSAEDIDNDQIDEIKKKIDIILQTTRNIKPERALTLFF